MKTNWRGQYTRYKSYMLNTVVQYNERRDIRTYLEILLSLATVSLFAIFALRPTLLTIAELLKDIESKEETIAIMDEKIENLAQGTSTYSANKDKIALLNQAIPDEPEPDILIRQLEGLVEKHPASVLTVGIENALLVGTNSTARTPSTDRGLELFPTNSTPLSFAINFTGDYTNLSRLIEDLELMRRPARIDTLNFTLRETRDLEDQLILTINGRVPYLSTTK